MSLSGKVFTLSNGNTIPAVAYGTGTKWFKLGRDEIDTNLVDTLKLALAKGFVHIDGAEIYNTDAEIGEAISGKDRDSLFITDKYFAGDSSYKARSSLGTPYDSLKFHLANKLKTDYVDLYLLHAPFIKKETHGFDLKEAWQSLEKAVHDGLTKNIGVSNFSVDDLKEVLEVAKIKPVVNQIEFNAYLQNQTPGVVEFSQQNGILVEAYSPLGPIVKGEPGEFTEYLETLGSKYSKSASQVLLRWVIQKNVLPVTTSAKEERIAQFVDLFDFKLADEEVKKITDLGAKHPVLRQYWTTEYAKYD
ncbi:CIC11C00000003389 [Sungouiella intermedia]|uniref:2-dehydropantolactone reductase n=1 Tax=Sungouiella intermedia TaxID=45354 RepID=A0A1L0BE83_9ASCO|nr:CIC11C00000003389 [[Candida] intermedia]